MDRETETAIDDILRIVPPSSNDESARSALANLAPQDLSQLRKELLAAEKRSTQIRKVPSSTQGRHLSKSSEMLSLRTRGAAALERLKKIGAGKSKPGVAATSAVSSAGEESAQTTEHLQKSDERFARALEQLSNEETETIEAVINRLIFDEDAGSATSAGKTRLAQALMRLMLSNSDVHRAFPILEKRAAETLRTCAFEDRDLDSFVGISLRSLASVVFSTSLANASLEVKGSIVSDRTPDHSDVRAASRRVLRSIIAHAPEFLAHHVTKTQAVNAIANVHRCLTEYRPDAIVVVSGGGKIVGDFLRGELNVPPGRYLVAHRDRDEVFIQSSEHKRFQRLAIIDDISRTGVTLERVRTAVMEKIGSDDLKTIALVSSAEAARRLSAESLIVPLIAAVSNVRLPWNTQGSYRDTTKEHVFGYKSNARSNRDALSIPKTFYSQVLDELRTIEA